MTEVWYIHGAASTPLSFDCLKYRLLPHSPVDIVYDIHTPLEHTINFLRDEVGKCEKPPIIIGHSLGGIIAAAIAQEVKTEKVITMSTPFGGSFAASVVRWFMPTQFMRDIAQQSPVLAQIRSNPPKVPMLSFVTDSNLMIFGEKTDGVVTVGSQTALKGPQYVHVNFNHFEVLLAPSVADQINNFAFQ